MCKILAVTGPLRRDKAEQVVNFAATSFAASQRDGFGFAALGDKENAYGRYLGQFSGWRSKFPDELSLLERDEQGQWPSYSKVLLCHGRTSTNQVALQLCHPFYERGNYLIHNGVLDWIGSPTMRPDSPNDSEQFAKWYDLGMAHNEINTHWAGYGAILIAHAHGVRLIKDGATLWCAKRQSRGFVFATDPNDLREVSKFIKIEGLSVSLKTVVADFGVNGELLSAGPWSGFASRKWDSLCALAMDSNPEPQLQPTKKWKRHTKL